jgi:hypothetical protein
LRRQGILEGETCFQSLETMRSSKADRSNLLNDLQPLILSFQAFFLAIIAIWAVIYAPAKSEVVERIGVGIVSYLLGGANALSKGAGQKSDKLADTVIASEVEQNQRG